MVKFKMRFRELSSEKHLGPHKLGPKVLGLPKTLAGYVRGSVQATI